MADEIIGYRVMRNRATGEVVGPPSPIFFEDWPYGDVSPDQPLLRYMDIWKFEDILRTRSLHFCRADKFKDPLEGKLSKEGVHGKSRSDFAQFKALNFAPQCYADLAEYRELARGVTFVSCWHINNNEDEQMWAEYTASPESILLISSAGLLKKALGQKVMMSSVKYVDENTPRTEFDNRSLFFYKDAQYAFEREYRLLIDLHDLGGSISENDPRDFFRKIPVDPGILIYALQPHPIVEGSDSAFDECHPEARYY